MGCRRGGRASVAGLLLACRRIESVAGARLDGESVDEIYADLTARRGGAGVDLTSAHRLPENAGVTFMGDTKGGPLRRCGRSARASGFICRRTRTAGRTPTF